MFLMFVVFCLGLDHIGLPRKMEKLTDFQLILPCWLKKWGEYTYYSNCKSTCHQNSFRIHQKT